MLVLVTTDSRPGGGMLDSPRVRPRRPEYVLQEAYVNAVRGAGGQPVLLPPGAANLESLLSQVSAVVITGGHFDIDPGHYGQEQRSRLDRIDVDRTDTELRLARLCLDRDVPVLGVCGGMQVLAVAAGGTLIQDIATEMPEALEHEQPTDPAEGWHQVFLESGMLRHVLGKAPVVNSTHHQAVADPGHMTITGRAPDGVAEVVEYPNHRFCLGVQWHPELLGLQPYRLLLDNARR